MTKPPKIIIHFKTFFLNFVFQVPTYTKLHDSVTTMSSSFNNWTRTKEKTQIVYGFINNKQEECTSKTYSNVI